MYIYRHQGVFIYLLKVDLRDEMKAIYRRSEYKEEVLIGKLIGINKSLKGWKIVFIDE